ncbi:TPA: TatD family deoxyribonuclease [Candidatus Bathyarchaeota archaeon]|nr:TatD family deoxyribonuclease [Candidatus Bathyarchaeota archaeon]
MILIDTHAHLEGIKNLDEALSRAKDAGVIAEITMGMDYSSNIWALQNSGVYSDALTVYPSLGIHPWVSISLDNERFDDILKLMNANLDKFVAVGEIGLDFWYREVRENEEARTLQRRVFKEMLNFAREYDKPVSIHSRGAWKDCLEMVISSNVEVAVFHWFSGPEEILKDLLDHGYYISATPAAAYSKEHRRAISEAPLENLVLETDSPVKYRGEISEPSWLIRCLEYVAEIKEIDIDIIAKRTTQNARFIFKI